MQCIQYLFSNSFLYAASADSLAWEITASARFLASFASFAFSETASDSFRWFSRSWISWVSSGVADTTWPLVNFNNSDNISDSCLCFIWIVSVRMATGVAATGEPFEDAGLVVDGTDEVEFVVEAGLVNWTVITAGPSWSSVRLTVIGTAGLWNFIRGRDIFQNFLFKFWSQLPLWEGSWGYGRTWGQCAHRESSRQIPCVFALLQEEELLRRGLIAGQAATVKSIRGFWLQTLFSQEVNLPSENIKVSINPRGWQLRVLLTARRILMRFITLTIVKILYKYSR